MMIIMLDRMLMVLVLVMMKNDASVLSYMICVITEQIVACKVDFVVFKKKLLMF